MRHNSKKKKKFIETQLSSIYDLVNIHPKCTLSLNQQQKKERKKEKKKSGARFGTLARVNKNKSYKTKVVKTQNPEP